MPIKRRAKVPRDAERTRCRILEAGDRLFSRFSPDVVGLKEVAREAEVSHGLITHYFATFEGLVEAVYERRAQMLSDAMLELLGDDAAFNDPARLITKLAERVAEPAFLRLLTWAVLSDRIGQRDFLANRLKGLKLVADLVEARVGGQTSRRQIEFVVIAVLTMTIGYGVASTSLQAGLGREGGPHADRDFRRRLADFVDGALRGGAKSPRSNPRRKARSDTAR